MPLPAVVRSALYAPAHGPDRIGTALAAGPDVVVVDLEDGVPPEAKEQARRRVGALVARVRAASVGVVVRVNGVGTTWFPDDVQAVRGAAPDAVLLPKAGDRELQALRSELGPQPIAVWALVERVRDVLDLDHALARGVATTVTLGYGDLCTELGLPLGTEHAGFDRLRRLVLAAARRWEVRALDGVVVGPPGAAAAACARSASDGFAGRTLYDARHVPGCHLAFEGARPRAGRRP